MKTRDAIARQLWQELITDAHAGDFETRFRIWGEYADLLYEIHSVDKDESILSDQLCSACCYASDQTCRHSKSGFHVCGRAFGHEFQKGDTGHACRHWRCSYGWLTRRAA